MALFILTQTALLALLIIDDFAPVHKRTPV
jgi:hypothetical protein